MDIFIAISFIFKVVLSRYFNINFTKPNKTSRIWSLKTIFIQVQFTKILKTPRQNRINIFSPVGAQINHLVSHNKRRDSTALVDKKKGEKHLNKFRSDGTMQELDIQPKRKKMYFSLGCKLYPLQFFVFVMWYEFWFGVRRNYWPLWMLPLYSLAKKITKIFSKLEICQRKTIGSAGNKSHSIAWTFKNFYHSWILYGPRWNVAKIHQFFWHQF